MIRDILASRYAKALCQLAADNDRLGRVHAEVEMLADILDPGRGEISVPELLTLLGMPRVPLEDKIRITDKMLETLDFSTEVGNLLNVLIAKNRVGLIGAIADQVRRRTARLKGVTAVSAESARPLSESDRSALRAALEAALHNEIDLTVAVREELLGGIRVRLGDTLIDGSVAGALDRLERELTR